MCICRRTLVLEHRVLAETIRDIAFGLQFECLGNTSWHLLDATVRDVRARNVKSNSSSCILRCADQTENILGRTVEDATSSV
jgi:hypothetical protein